MGAKKWDGFCPAGLHGLDHQGQRCAMCEARDEREARAEQPRPFRIGPAGPPWLASALALLNAGCRLIVRPDGSVEVVKP